MLTLNMDFTQLHKISLYSLLPLPVTGLFWYDGSQTVPYSVSQFSYLFASYLLLSCKEDASYADHWGGWNSGMKHWRIW